MWFFRLGDSRHRAKPNMEEEERIRLFGAQLPVRVIGTHPLQSGPSDEHVPPADESAHSSLDEHEVDRSFDAVHQSILHYQDEAGTTHRVEVSSANKGALEGHLKSAKIWLHTKPSAPADAAIPTRLTGHGLGQHLPGEIEEPHRTVLGSRSETRAFRVERDRKDLASGGTAMLPPQGFQRHGVPHANESTEGP